MAKVSTYLFLLLSISFVLSAIVDEVDVSSPDASKAFEAKFKSGLFSNLKDDANDSFDMCERRINPSESLSNLPTGNNPGCSFSGNLSMYSPESSAIVGNLVAL